jgi:hypothetical protein
LEKLSGARIEVHLEVREGTVMKKRLRCLLGMHTWQRQHTEDNQAYRACVHCGVEDVGSEGRRPGVGGP